MTTSTINPKILKELKSFFFAFQINRTTVFEINYYRLGGNKNKYFTTSAAQFNRPKTDFKQCGQAQLDLLDGKAMLFYKKWDVLHLEDLDNIQHADILIDIDTLKEQYNFIEADKDINFQYLKSLSMLKVKK